MTANDIIDAIRAAMTDHRNWGLDRYEYRPQPNWFRARLAVPALGDRFRVECDIQVLGAIGTTTAWIHTCEAFDTYCDDTIAIDFDALAEGVILANLAAIPIFRILYEHKAVLYADSGRGEHPYDPNCECPVCANKRAKHLVPWR